MNWSERTGPVVVIGASGIDIVGRPLADLEPGTSNPGALRISHGGVARNIAENLVHLGLQTQLITAVGNDDSGQQILNRLQQAGVDISRVIVDEDADSGAYLALLDDSGGLQHGLDDMGVVANLTPEYLAQYAADIASAAVLLMDGNLPPESFEAALRIAKANDVPVAVDPTSRQLADRIKPHLPDIDLVAPNEGEAERLADIKLDPGDEAGATSAARRLVREGVALAMVTMAEFGVSYATSDSSGQVPARRTEILDPTGAGDALLATVVFGLLNDIPVDESVRLGVTAASLTLRVRDSVVPDLSLELLYDQLL